MTDYGKKFWACIECVENKNPKLKHFIVLKKRYRKIKKIFLLPNSDIIK